MDEESYSVEFWVNVLKGNQIFSTQNKLILLWWSALKKRGYEALWSNFSWIFFYYLMEGLKTDLLAQKNKLVQISSLSKVEQWRSSLQVSFIKEWNSKFHTRDAISNFTVDANNSCYQECNKNVTRMCEMVHYFNIPWFKEFYLFKLC